MTTTARTDMDHLASQQTVKLCKDPSPPTVNLYFNFPVLAGFLFVLFCLVLAAWGERLEQCVTELAADSC